MDDQQLLREVTYRAVRSSGAGGQHVNKVASKVELHFVVPDSQALGEEEKQRLLRKLASRLTTGQELILQCEESRSQHKNKQIVTQRFLELIEQGLKKARPRKKTRIPRAVEEKRLREKKLLSEKKNARRDPLKE